MSDAEWIGLTWGANYPQVTVIDAAGKTIAQHAGPTDLAPGNMADFLAPYLSAHRTTPVLCAGLQGIPTDMFRAVPTAPMAGTIQIGSPDPRLALHVVPGLRQAKPADLMLGCETAISGLLSQDPEFDGVVFTVAAQSRWSHISAGEVVSFQSFLTPVLANMLSSNPPLSECVSHDALDGAAFAQAVDDVMTRPQTVAATLAQIPADAALYGVGGNVAWSRLMGSLIGLELSGSRPYWLGQRVALLGDGPLTDLYATALDGQGVQVQIMSRDALLLEGLKLAWRRINSN